MLGPVVVFVDAADKLGVIAGEGPEVEAEEDWTDNWLSLGVMGGRVCCIVDSLGVSFDPRGLFGRPASVGILEDDGLRTG